MSAWNFQAWFDGQCGKRPTREDENQLRDRIKSIRASLAADEAMLAAVEAWEAKRTSARYAWNLTDADKATRMEAKV